MVLMANAAKLLLTAWSWMLAASKAPAMVIWPALEAMGMTVYLPLLKLTSLAAISWMLAPALRLADAATSVLGAIKTMSPPGALMRPSTWMAPVSPPLKLGLPAMNAASVTFCVLATKPPLTLIKPSEPNTMPFWLIKNTRPLPNKVPSIWLGRLPVTRLRVAAWALGATNCTV